MLYKVIPLFQLRLNCRIVFSGFIVTRALLRDTEFIKVYPSSLDYLTLVRPDTMSAIPAQIGTMEK